MLLSLSGILFEDGSASQSVTFREFCEIAQGAGYAGVELRRTQVNPDTPRAERRERLAIVKDHGLRVTCLTARGLPDTGAERDDRFRRMLELCADLECRLMKIVSDPAWLRQAAAAAAEAGVALAANNHMGGPLETVAGTRSFLADVGHPNFGLLYGPLHLRMLGQDYIGCIPEFLDRTRNILVQSLRPARSGEEAQVMLTGGGWVHALPDEDGVQDWPAILAAYRLRGYDGLVTVIENGWPQPRRHAVAREAAAALRTLWG